MRPPRTSPWDAEFVVATHPTDEQGMLHQWSARARLGGRPLRRLTSARRAALFQFIALGIACICFAAVGVCAAFQPSWLEAGRFSWLGPTMVGLIGGFAILEILRGAWVALRRPSPPGGPAVFMARQLRIAPYHLASRGLLSIDALGIEHARRTTWWLRRL